MLKFHTIKWRNFLSTGNNFIEVQLDKTRSSLITGENGSGKSTLIDALMFVLFGKPHRKINKPQLVNSINNKNCEVEVTFSIGKNHYKVIRGIKPNIFEIYRNDELIDQESHALDYQKILEQNILKMSEKSFRQIVLIGSNSYIPFMQLPTYHRRDIIEDLLDINIFTGMKQLLKERVSKVKDNFQAANYDLNIIIEKIKIQKSHIDEINRIRKENDAKKLEKIDSYTNKINILETEIEELSQNLTDEYELDLNKLSKKITKLDLFQQQIKDKIANVEKHKSFYIHTDKCPTCDQNIDNEIKKSKTNECDIKRKEYEQGLKKILEEREKTTKSLEEFKIEQQKTNLLKEQISEKRSELRSIINHIKNLKTEIKEDKTNTFDEFIKKLESLELEYKDIEKTKNDYFEEILYYNLISEILKDNGVKSKIIKYYLPTMNKFINGYLQMLDFFVSFNLDENFNETIKSRHRDSFSYSSFSEGEKTRINIALLFTWRQISKLKNSASTNLLIMDETMDSSMDAEGINNLFTILNEIDKETNVFIISHRDVNIDKFSRIIRIDKKNGFSHYNEDLQVVGNQ